MALAIEKSTERYFPRKSIIYHHGDSPRQLYRVKVGLVKLARVSPKGNIMSYDWITPGCLFGEEMLLNLDGRLTDAIAARETIVTLVDPAANMAEAIQAIGRRLNRNYEMREALLDYRKAMVVARVLCNMPTLEVTHQEIAETVGSSREVVTRALNHFKDMGLLDMRHSKITIPDPEQLLAEAGNVICQ